MQWIYTNKHLWTENGHLDLTTKQRVKMEVHLFPEKKVFVFLILVSFQMFKNLGLIFFLSLKN